jgi:hypothetical protein
LLFGGKNEMDPQMFCIYLPVLVAILLALLLIGRHLLNSKPDNEIEAELDRDKEESDGVRITAEQLATGVVKSKEFSARIGESQQRASDSVGKAEKAIARAREKGRKTVELADECLAILEEAEKKDEFNN